MTQATSANLLLMSLVSPLCGSLWTASVNSSEAAFHEEQVLQILFSLLGLSDYETVSHCTLHHNV